jgi:hypothetical protein
MYIDTAKAVQQFATNVNEMRSVINDTVFAAPVTKPVVAKKDSVKNSIIQSDSKKQTITNKKPVTEIKKTSKPVVNKKQPKAVMKKPG